MAVHPPPVALVGKSGVEEWDKASGGRFGEHIGILYRGGRGWMPAFQHTCWLLLLCTLFRPAGQHSGQAACWGVGRAQLLYVCAAALHFAFRQWGGHTASCRAGGQRGRDTMCGNDNIYIPCRSSSSSLSASVAWSRPVLACAQPPLGPAEQCR